MAITDSQYKFLFINVRCNGRKSDGGVFYQSSFGDAMNNDALNFTPASWLPGREEFQLFW